MESFERVPLEDAYIRLLVLPRLDQMAPAFASLGSKKLAEALM